MADKKIYWVVAEVNTRNAGYRIRTLPLVKALALHEMHIELLSMKELHADITEIAMTAAVVIVAKPGDSDSYLCMRYLTDCGVMVIVDLFDNYFSWSPALYKRGIVWHWLRSVEVSSAICTSTETIAETARAIGFGNICTISDAAPDVHRPILPAVNLHKKWDAPIVLELLWFGISDNPYFNAGIEDLISWTTVVAALQRSLQPAYSVRLTLCTNRVPAVQDAIMYFIREGIEVRFEEWTEEGCAQLLSDSHVVLIPTNLSTFSRSKTHNRCSDAIWRQCLVLASGSGPYRDIPGAVHISLPSMISTLQELDRENIARQLNESAAYISSHHQVAEHAYRLAQLINETRLAPAFNTQMEARLPPVLLAGGSMPISTLKLSRKIMYLSAGIAGSAVNGNFDLLLVDSDADHNTLTFELSQKCTDLFIPDTQVFIVDDIGTKDWSVVMEGSIARLTISMPHCAASLNRFRALNAIRHAHPDLFEQWFEIAIELSIRVLQRLGFTAIEFGASDGGGWQSWPLLCGQHLQKHAKLLRSTWVPGHLPGVEECPDSSIVS